MISPSSLCQIEIQVNDLDRSLHFYREVFGWEAVPAEIHEVTVLSVPEECPYGISLVSGRHGTELQKGRIILYFPSENPNLLMEKAIEHGGKPRFGPKKLQGYGIIYQVEDPDGVRWGLFQRPPT